MEGVIHDAFRGRHLVKDSLFLIIQIIALSIFKSKYFELFSQKNCKYGIWPMTITSLGEGEKLCGAFLEDYLEDSTIPGSSGIGSDGHAFVCPCNISVQGADYYL